MLLGLDVSSKATGVAFLQGAHVCAHICLKIPHDVSLQRAIAQHTALDGMLKGHVPDFAVVEAYAFHGRGNATHMLVEAGTMIRYTLVRRRVPWFEVGPSQLKKFATGNGLAKKPDMVEAAARLTGYEGKDHNVADAALLGLLGHVVSYLHAEEAPLVELDDRQLQVATSLIPAYVAGVVDFS